MMATNSQLPVGRPREFDLDEAVRRAMQVFWDRGYHDTSLPDLLAGMKLSKGSFYKAFGDKHSLFIEAFRRYLDGIHAQVEQLFKELPPSAAIRQWVELTQGFGKEPGLRKGCMGCNTTVELAPHDPEIQRVIRSHWKRSEETLTKAISRGQAEGGFRTDIPASSLARFLLMSAAGAAACSKASIPSFDEDDLTEVILSSLTE